MLEQLKQLSFSFLGLDFNKTDNKSVLLDTSLSDHNLKETWDTLIDKYFNSRQELKTYKVIWSGRNQKRVLASCNIYKRIVRVAPAMRYGDAPNFLEPLIFHELCHAVVGFKVVGKKRIFHSKNFRIEESRHPGINLLNDWIRAGGWSNSVKISKRKLKRKK